MTPTELRLWTCRAVIENTVALALAQPRDDRLRVLVALGYPEMKQMERLLVQLLKEERHAAKRYQPRAHRGKRGSL